MSTTGDQGDQGDQGEQGVVGERGESGDRGISGERGPKGDHGQHGEPGPTGDKGRQGRQGEQGKNPAATRSFILVVAVAIVALLFMGWQVIKVRSLARANHAQIAANTLLIREVKQINDVGSFGACKEVERLKASIRHVIASRLRVPPAQTARELAPFTRRPCPRVPHK